MLKRLTLSLIENLQLLGSGEVRNKSLVLFCTLHVVITYSYKLELYNELVEMRKACGEAHMKSILAVGELGTLTNVYKASLVAMMAGSDFIKTSTG